MKNLKNITVIFFVIFIIFIILLVITLKVSNSKNNQKLKVYYEENISNINSIQVQKSEQEPFIINKNYEIKGFEGISLNKASVDLLFNFVQKIEAEHIFYSKESSVSKYGLDKPIFKFVVNGQDNNFTIKIGKKSFDNFGYYVNVEDKTKNNNGRICIVNAKKVDQILIDKLDYVNLKLIKSYEKTFGEDGKYNGDGVQKCEIERKDLKNPLKFQVNDDGEVVLVSPKDLEIDKKSQKVIEEAPHLLNANKVYSVKPSRDDLKKSGVDDPVAVVRYVIDGKKYVFKIGNIFKLEQIGGSENKVNSLKYYYVTLEGQDVIYVISENLLPWLEIGSKNKK